jgi:hypothetical protein
MQPLHTSASESVSRAIDGRMFTVRDEGQPFINPENIPPKLILGQKRGIGTGEKKLVFDHSIR